MRGFLRTVRKTLAKREKTILSSMRLRLRLSSPSFFSFFLRHFSSTTERSSLFIDLCEKLRVSFALYRSEGFFVASSMLDYLPPFLLFFFGEVIYNSEEFKKIESAWTNVVLIFNLFSVGFIGRLSASF